MVDISGNWGGWYSDFNHEGKEYKVLFFAEIRASLFQIIGRIREDTKTGGIADDHITLEGNVNGRRISFLKQYSMLHGIDEDGNPFSDPEAEPVPVSYEGEYDPESNRYKGAWFIADYEERDGIIYENDLTGNWEMWKLEH